MKRASLVVSGLLALALPLVAQTSDDADNVTNEQLRTTGEFATGPALSFYRSDLFSSVDSTVLIHDLPALTLLDGRRFPISSDLGRMGFAPLDLFPVAFLQSVQVKKVASSPMTGTDAPGGTVDLRLNRGYATGGEAGVFFGKSSGKYGREDFETYVIGTVGNDKFQITAGAAYDESSVRIPRLRR